MFKYTITGSRIPFCFEGPERNRRRRPSLFQLIFRRREKDTTRGGMVWCKYCPKTFFSLTLSRGPTEENEGRVLLPPNISHLLACVCKGAATATIFRGFLLLLPFGFLARRTTTTTTPCYPSAGPLAPVRRCIKRIPSYGVRPLGFVAAYRISGLL